MLTFNICTRAPPSVWSDILAGARDGRSLRPHCLRGISSSASPQWALAPALPPGVCGLAVLGLARRVVLKGFATGQAIFLGLSPRPRDVRRLDQRGRQGRAGHSDSPRGRPRLAGIYVVPPTHPHRCDNLSLSIALAPFQIFFTRNRRSSIRSNRPLPNRYTRGARSPSAPEC